MLKGCGGFPLAIEVIGGSLCGQPAPVQRSRVKKLSSNHFSFNSNLLNCLQRSLEFSDDELILKECFMDLGSFPEDQRIPVAALIEMWAELYELSEDGIDALANLYELTFQNLASLVTKYGDLISIVVFFLLLLLHFCFVLFFCSVISSCNYG